MRFLKWIGRFLTFFPPTPYIMSDAEAAAFDREALARDLATLKRQRNEAIKAIGDLSGRLGEAEGKLLVSKEFQLLDGWIQRTAKAERERDEVRLFNGQLMEQLRQRNAELEAANKELSTREK